MPHRHVHRRKSSRSEEKKSFNYARPWKVFLSAAVLVFCVWTVLDVVDNYQYQWAQQNLEYHVNDLDGVDFEHPQVNPDWGFFKKIGRAISTGVKAVVKTVKKVVKTAVKVVVGIVNFGAALVNVAGMYLGLRKCVAQRFPIYPKVNPWSIGILQQANYEKPLSAQGNQFKRIGQAFINKNKFKGQGTFQVLEAVVINEWRLVLARDVHTKYLWVCFRGTKTMNNWVDNARKFFKLGGGKLASNYRRMGEAIKGWQRKYAVAPNRADNRLYGFIGHSAGGWYANKVATNYDVWRITLNAYDTTKRSRRHVNFRTTKDMVSAMKSMSNYACLKYCAKGHSNIDFVNCWRHRYSRYSVSAFAGLWAHTYDGFKGAAIAPKYPNVPNQVVNHRVVNRQRVRNGQAPRGGALDAPGGPGLISRRPVRANTRGWTPVFMCWGDGRSYRNRWYLNWRTLVRRARSNYYQIMFVNPRRTWQWAMSNEFNGQWQRNLANGKALSYVRNGVNSYGWAHKTVSTSLNGLSHNFGYTCSNNANPNFPRNIYWACGNGRNGFHVIPSSRICRWSWSGRGYYNFAVRMYIKRIGFYPPAAPEVRLRGWQKAYECSTLWGNKFSQRWTINPNSLIASARTNVYAFLFVNPRNQREWVMMNKPRNLFAQNLRAGRALSYNPGCRGRCGLNKRFINGQVAASYGPLKEHFAYSCGNSRNPSFRNNIYWACGNGENGFHVIPSSRICKWSWSGNFEQTITMYVRKIGVWNPPRRRRGSSSD